MVIHYYLQNLKGKSMTKKFHLFNILIYICAMITLIYYDSHRHMILKGITSAWFVLLGTINILYAYKCKIENINVMIYIVIGLFLGMCADVFLWFSLIFGILFFASGHIFYIIAFFQLEKFKTKDVYVIIEIAVVSIFIVFVSGFITITDPLIYVLLIGYTCIISIMLGKACTNYFSHKSLSRLIMLIGCFMFWFSDLMLAFDMFGNVHDIVGQLCVYTYWPAQNILAYSLYHYTNEKNA